MRRFLYSLGLGLAIAGATVLNASAQTLAVNGGEPSAAQTQSIDIPKTLSYQGLVTAKDGQPVKDGDYAITVTLYNDADGQNSVWKGTYTAHVTGGVFSLTLGGGDQPLPSAVKMDGQLFAGVSFNGEAMSSLTPLSAAPYALNVADGAVTAKKMGTDYVGGVTVNGQTITGRGTNLNIVTDGMDASVDPSTNTLALRGTTIPTIKATGAGAQSNTTITGTLTVTGNTYLQSDEYLGSSGHAANLYLYGGSGSNKADIKGAGSYSGNWAYTVPDVGSNASFVMTEGTQTINGSKTFSSNLATNGISNTGTIGSTGDIGTSAGMLISGASGGAAGSVKLWDGGTNSATIGTATQGAGNTYTIPATGTNSANFVMTQATGTQTITTPIDASTGSGDVKVRDTPTDGTMAINDNYLQTQLGSGNFVMWDRNDGTSPLDQVSVDAAHDTYNAINLTKNYNNIDYDDHGNSADGDLFHMKVLGQGSGGAGAPYTVSLASELAGSVTSGHLATITTTTPHDFSVGEKVDISGMSVGGYNGTWTIATIPTSTSFTFFDDQTGLADDNTSGTIGLNAEGNSITAKWDANGIVWSQGLNADNISNYTLDNDLNFTSNGTGNLVITGDYGNFVVGQHSMSLGNGLQDATNVNAGSDARGRLYFNDESGTFSSDPTTSNTVLVLAPTATTNATQILQGNMSGNLSIGGIGNGSTAGSILTWDPTQNTGDYATAGGRYMENTNFIVDGSGNVTSGTWQATVVSPTYGGTGVSNPTQYGVMVAEGSSPMNTVTGSSNTVLHANTGGDPTFSAVDLTADVTGVLPVANGGTNNDGTFFTNNGVAYYDGNTNAVVSTSNGSQYNVLTVNGLGQPTLGAMDLSQSNAVGTSILGIANGGTNANNATDAFDNLAPTSAQGDIIYNNGTNNVALAAGTTGMTLHTNGASANPSWAKVDVGSTSEITGTMATGNGGTGYSSYSTGDLLVGNGSSSLSQLGIGTTGDILTVSGGTATWNDGSGLFIQNQNAGAQTADFWIGGSGRIDGGLTVHGGADINTAGSDGTTTIGNTSDDATVNGDYVTLNSNSEVDINANSFSGSTNIGTAGFTGDVSIGASGVFGNSTNLNSNTVNIASATTGGLLQTAPTTGAVSNGDLSGDVLTSGTLGTSINTNPGNNNIVTAINSGTGVINVANGGTGDATLTTNGVVYGNGTSAAGVTAAGSQYQTLQPNGSGVPVWTAVALNQSAAVSGTLPVTHGGTGSTSYTGNQIVVSNAGGTALVSGGAGTTTTVLHGNASGAPSYGPVVNGDITDGTIQNVKLANSTIGVTSTNSTLNVTGSPISLGGSGNVDLNLNHSNAWNADQTIINGHTLGVSGSITTGDATHAGTLVLYDNLAQTMTLNVNGTLAGNRTIHFPDPGSSAANVIVEHLQGGGSQNIQSLTLSTALPLTSGGTGVTAVGLGGSVVSANDAQTAYQFSNQPTDGQFLAAVVGGGVHTPTWVSMSGNATMTNAGVVTVNSSTNFSGSLSGDVTGTQSATTVGKIQNRTVAATAPTNGQVLTWVTANSDWEPAASSVSSLTFTNITSGTNNAAAMVVGTGASLNYTLSGTINASSLQGNTWASPAAIGTGTAASGKFTTVQSTSLGTGVVHSDASGNFTSSAVSLTGDVSGTLPVANGGTGQTTLQAAMNSLAGATTSGSYLRGNGTNVVMSTIQAGDVPTLNQNTTGNAATATALQTARNINGVSFNGTADITVTAAAGTLTGSTLASGVTASSLTSVGTLTNLTVTNPISGSVTGTATGLSGTNLTGDVTNSGNTVTVTKIQGRSILNAAPANGDVLTWDNANSRWAPVASSVSSLPFANVTGGTNNTANAMVVGSTSSLDYSGTGTINASSLNGQAGSYYLNPANLTSGTAAINISGTATNATNIATTTTSANSTYYPVFVGANSTSNQGADVNGSLSYNPSTGALSATSFNGAVSGSTVTTDQVLATSGTAIQTANTGNSYTSSTVATFAGRVAVQNTSGGTLGTITVTVNNSKVTSNSVIILSPGTNANSASGVEYLANEVTTSRSAGTSFTFVLHRATPSGSASFVNNEGAQVSYIIIN